MVTDLFPSFLNVCGKSIRIMHKRLKILRGAAPQIVEGLQNTLVPLSQFGKTGLCDKQPMTPLIRCLPLFP